MQQTVQFTGLDRFDDIFHDAQSERLLLDLGLCLRRQRNQRKLCTLREGANLLGRFQAAHYRHLQVEKHEIESVPAGRFDGLGTVGDDLNLVSATLEQGANDQLRRRCVLCDQDAQLLADGPFGGAGGAVLGFSDGRESDFDKGGRAPTRRAVDTNTPAHQIHEPPADRQPESGAADLLLPRRRSPLEGFEHTIDLVRRYSAAGIHDLQADNRLALTGSDRARTTDDLARLGKLCGVADEVDQHLV